MKPLFCTHRSSAPPDRMWAMASDFAHAAGRIKAITMEVHARPRTFGAKLLSPLMSMMSKVMVKSCAKDLGDIAAAAERGGDTTGEVRLG